MGAFVYKEKNSNGEYVVIPLNIWAAMDCRECPEQPSRKCACALDQAHPSYVGDVVIKSHFTRAR